PPARGRALRPTDERPLRRQRPRSRPATHLGANRADRRSVSGDRRDRARARTRQRVEARGLPDVGADQLCSDRGAAPKITPSLAAAIWLLPVWLDTASYRAYL